MTEQQASTPDELDETQTHTPQEPMSYPNQVEKSGSKTISAGSSILREIRAMNA